MLLATTTNETPPHLPVCRYERDLEAYNRTHLKRKQSDGDGVDGGEGAGGRVDAGGEQPTQMTANASTLPPREAPTPITPDAEASADTPRSAKAAKAATRDTPKASKPPPTQALKPASKASGGVVIDTATGKPAPGGQAKAKSTAGAKAKQPSSASAKKAKPAPKDTAAAAGKHPPGSGTPRKTGHASSVTPHRPAKVDTSTLRKAGKAGNAAAASAVGGVASAAAAATSVKKGDGKTASSSPAGTPAIRRVVRSKQKAISSFFGPSDPSRPATDFSKTVDDDALPGRKSVRQCVDKHFPPPPFPLTPTPLPPLLSLPFICKNTHTRPYAHTHSPAHPLIHTRRNNIYHHHPSSLARGTSHTHLPAAS